MSTHLSHHPRSRHPSLLHSFTPGSKPTFSTNPFHLRLFHLLDCLMITGLDRSYHAFTLIILFLVSHFNFLFIPCGRLSWLPVSFLLHAKYTLSYRIVSYQWRQVAIHYCARNSVYATRYKLRTVGSLDGFAAILGRRQSGKFDCCCDAASAAAAAAANCRQRPNH